MIVGNGYGKKLVEYAIEVLDINYVDVNEQNPQAQYFINTWDFKFLKDLNLMTKVIIEYCI